MMISVIAAIGRNRVIGDEHGLPWRLPSDLQRFRRLTWGKPVIMGRKTFELIGKPLPGRESVILTHDDAYRAPLGCHIATSVSEALTIAKRLAHAAGQTEIMVIGGAEVYRQFLGLADRVYLTTIDGEFEGTAFFPRDFPTEDWTVTSSEFVPADDRNLYSHYFAVRDRITAVPRGMTAAPAGR